MSVSIHPLNIGMVLRLTYCQLPWFNYAFSFNLFSASGLSTLPSLNQISGVMDYKTFQIYHLERFVIYDRFLVGPTRENWNYIFPDLQLLCERLEELDIEALMEADNK